MDKQNLMGMTGWETYSKQKELEEENKELIMELKKIAIECGFDIDEERSRIVDGRPKLVYSKYYSFDQMMDFIEKVVNLRIDYDYK